MPDVRTVVISANFGFDEPVTHVPQSVECDFVHFAAENFPLRSGAMTPRLQARLVKLFSWQLVPGYDNYLWVDTSCAFTNPDSVKWFIEQLGDNQVALFKHPHRNTVQEEADYLKHRLSIKCPYITPRYENE